MSPEARVMQPSDWATAWVAAETLHRLYTEAWRAGLLAEFTKLATRLIPARVMSESWGADDDADDAEYTAADAARDAEMVKLADELGDDDDVVNLAKERLRRNARLRGR